MLQFILKIFYNLIGIILSIFFILIPTILFNPQSHIKYIEKDLNISIPDNFDVIYKYEDRLAFEMHQEVKLKFSEENFNNILNQVESNLESINGTWINTKEGYIFTLEDEFIGNNNYYFDAKLDIDERTLLYKYSNF